MGALGSTAAECGPVARQCGQGDMQAEASNGNTTDAYLIAQGDGAAGASKDSRDGSRGGSLPVELGDLKLRQDTDFDDPPPVGADDNCDMKLWAALPDPHAKGQCVSSRKPTTDSQYSSARSDGDGPPPPVGSSDEARDPPAPQLVNSYFDEDIGEGPRHDDPTEAGRRRFVFHSGAEYDGDWQSGQRHGIGRQSWPDTAEYIGEWYHGRAGGNGRMRHVDGDVYSGQWVNGRAHGHGVYRFQGGNAVYEGEFEADLRHGTGVEVWIDGSWYAGDFKKGAKHGMGQHTWPDGTCYSGCWNNNELAGVGRYDVTNGPKYQGHWKDSIIDGFGIYSWPDGRKYEGEYENDKKQGFGIIFDEDGTQRSGWWDSGMMLKRQRNTRETSAQYKKSTREGRSTQRKASKDKPRRSSFFS